LSAHSPFFPLDALIFGEVKPSASFRLLSSFPSRRAHDEGAVKLRFFSFSVPFFFFPLFFLRLRLSCTRAYRSFSFPSPVTSPSENTFLCSLFSFPLSDEREDDPLVGWQGLVTFFPSSAAGFMELRPHCFFFSWPFFVCASSEILDSTRDGSFFPE